MTRDESNSADIDIVRRHLHRMVHDVSSGPDLLDAAHAYAERRYRRTSTILAVASAAAVICLGVIVAPLLHDASDDRGNVPRPQTSGTATTASAPQTSSATSALPACSTGFPSGKPMPTATTALQAVIDTGFVSTADTLAVATDEQITGIDLKAAQTVVDETNDGKVIARYVVTRLTDGSWQLARIYRGSAGVCDESAP